jgi:hypothetical protein
LNLESDSEDGVKGLAVSTNYLGELPDDELPIVWSKRIEEIEKLEL